MAQVLVSQRPNWLFKNFAFALFFFFFLTLSADLIHLEIGLFLLKLTHVAGFLILLVLFLCQKGMILNKSLFHCFLWILAAMLASSLVSPCSSRSAGYALIWIFTFFVFFAVPINLMRSFDENKILKIYLGSYLLIGSYAAMQFFGSILGFELPFSVQKLVFVRGSALAHEPSFYALYAIPLVTFLNAKYLFSNAVASKTAGRGKDSGFYTTLLANLFLLVSTSTTAFFSYVVFFFCMLLFRRLPGIKPYFQGVRKKLLKAAFLFMGFFSIFWCFFSELFEKTFLKFFYFGLDLHSFYHRINGITSAFQVFCEHPLLGVGLGGVGPYLFKQEYFPEYNGPVSEIDRQHLEKFDPTNVFTEVLGSLGVAGLIAFSALFFVIWKKFLKVLSDPRLFPAQRINVMSLLISTIVMLVCMQVNQGLFRAYIWVHLGLSVGYVMKISSKLQQR
jgi:hypothetical protein